MGGLLPVFVLDRYEGYEVKLVQDCSREELERWVEANAAALREHLPADVVFSNHVLLGGPVGAATGAPFAVKAHGSELEYTLRGSPELAEWGEETLEQARAVFVGSNHIRAVLDEVVGHVENVHEVPPGVDVDDWRPRPRAEALAGLVEEARRDPPNPGNANERLPDESNAERLARFLDEPEPTVVYFGKLLYNKGVHVLLEALRDVDARAVIVGFGDYRDELERLAGPNVLFTGPLEHRHLVHLLPLADATVVPSIFPEAFGMVAAEAAAAGSPPLVARHSGLAEIADGLEAEYPAQLRHLASFATGDAADLAAKLNELLALNEADRPRSPEPPGEPCSTAGAGRASRVASWNRSHTLLRMADDHRLSPDELLRDAREAFDEGTDFTVAVEEEFALLDPASLDLVNRFEEVKAAAQGTPLEPNLVGELIASEVEVKTGRCETFAEIPAALVERRAQLQALVEPLELALGATGTHPWAPWQEQRIIDTPHYRRNDEILRYVVWRNNSFGLHVHVGIRGADRTIGVVNGLRAFLPELLALSASSPFHERVNTGLHSARTQVFTRFFPRCGVPDAFASWREYEDYVRFLYATRSIDEATQLWWSVRPHLSFPTVEIRICDAQPDPADAISLAAFATALAARIARALDEGEPLAEQPHRLIEENLWRAIRHGLSGELIDLERGDVVPARERLERLLDWVAPVAEEIGAAPYLAIPDRNAAERQIARFEEGATLEQIYAEQVGIPVRG